MAEAFPLQWPAGLSRTPSHRRGRAAFKQTLKTSIDFLLGEVRRMGGLYATLSSDMQMRRDGLPYAQQRQPDDPGVAVYFLRGKQQMVFACDRWDRAHDNIYAIAKTIEAIRGIERWGSSDMMERAFAAFQALPAPEQWWQVLGVPQGVRAEEIDAAYRAKARLAHPDAGGSDAAMARLNAAREAGRAALNGEGE